MANLCYSINSLKEEINKNEHYFSAPLNIIFLCSAPISLNDIDPSKLPESPTALDMYVLKNQNIVLTTTWITDLTITMNFANCKKEIFDRFSQTLILTQKPYNQALVIVDKTFQFIGMNDSQKFNAKITPDLTRVYTTINHLINQENAFLRQITLFNKMLTSADILLDVNSRLKRTASINSPKQQPKIIFEKSSSVNPENLPF